MKIIPIIRIQNDRGFANHPSEPIPNDAILVTSDGLSYTVYEDGDRLPYQPTKTAREMEIAAIKAEILALEERQTTRRIRDFILGNDDGWMQNLDEKIAILRSKIYQ